MKYCEKCGQETKPGADICLHCGHILNAVPVNTKQVKNSNATAGLVFGVIGLLILPLLFGVSAFVLSIIGLSKSKETGVGKKNAIIGMCLGIFNVVYWILANYIF